MHTQKHASTHTHKYTYSNTHAHWGRGMQTWSYTEMCGYMEKVCMRVCVCVFRGRAGGQLYHYTLNAWASIDAVVTLYFHCSCCRCSCWGLPAAAAAAAAIAIAVQQDNLFGSNIAAFRHLLAALGHSLISITYANIHPNAELNTELINCNFIQHAK